jgi:hypothetical protein
MVSQLTALYPIFFLTLVAVIVITVARVFHAGIACAREEAHRVTPQDSWVFFRRGSRGKGWPATLALFAFAAFGVHRAWELQTAHGDWTHSLHSASLILTWGFIVLVTSISIAYLIAPRVGGLLALSLTLLAITLVLVQTGQFALTWALPSEWTTVTYAHTSVNAAGGISSIRASVPTAPYFELVLFTVFSLAASQWARRQGARWFRFEE